MSNPSPPRTSTTMPPLTLIVATTPTLGIGLRGSLPWPPLKSDLAFFARVTKRPPPPSLHPSSSSTTTSSSLPPNSNGARKPINAVIMGRKTWDSIPPKFRPLKERVNVVISRNSHIIEELGNRDGDTSSESTKTIGVGSLTHALQLLQERYGDGGKGAGELKLGRVFVIGGASIYEQAMSMENCERILWTRVNREFECDVFFPARSALLSGIWGGKVWTRKSKEELRGWCGEESVGDVVREGDVEFEIQMWERDREVEFEIQTWERLAAAAKERGCRESIGT